MQDREIPFRAFALSKTLHGFVDSLDPHDRTRPAICQLLARLNAAFSKMEEDAYVEAWHVFEAGYDKAKPEIYAAGYAIYPVYAIGTILADHKGELLPFLQMTDQAYDQMARSITKGKFRARMIKTDLKTGMKGRVGTELALGILVKWFNKTIYDMTK